MSKLNHNLPHVSRILRAILASFEPARQTAILAKKAKVKSNPVSKFFRHIFEHSKIRTILGSQLVFATIAASVIQVPTHAQMIVSGEDVPMIIKSEKISFVTQKGIVDPLTTIKINQGFRFFHPGIDFEGTTGEPVYSIMAGKVEATQQSRFAYGNAVIVDHGSGVTTLYAHLSKIEVEPGDTVNAGTEIGLVGSTGRSTGDHLHLEVREDGRAINPLSILPR